MSHVDGLVQDCSNSSALAMELLQSCTKPSMYGFGWITWNHRIIFFFLRGKFTYGTAVAETQFLISIDKRQQKGHTQHKKKTTLPEELVTINGLNPDIYVWI